MRATAKRQPRAGGFTLTEVTLMMGIVIFALLPMVALLVMGKDSVRKTVDRSRAPLIAEAIFADLRTSTGSGIRIRIEPLAYDTALTPANCIGEERYVIYDAEGQAFVEAGAAEYENGWPSSAGGATTMVRIAFDETGRVHSLGHGGGLAGSGASMPQPTGLVLVTVTVETPVTAPVGNRKKEQFTALMTLTDER